MTRRNGDWTQLLSGTKWWAHDPRPEDVHEEDFPAVALVMRWGGGMRYQPGHPRAGKLAPYSIGQHMCLVYELITAWGGSLIERACGLYHDLPEIVPPGDILRPVLNYTIDDPQFVQVRSCALKAMKEEAERAFFTALNLPLEHPPIVKRADNVLLATERRDFKPPMPPEHRRDKVTPLERRIEAWDADHTEEAWMRRHRAVQAELLAAGLPGFKRAA
jgi:hypothetical protein